MAGTTAFPGAVDDFAAASPTNLGDDDSTGRTHSERHDDTEAAMEAVQTFVLGLADADHSGNLLHNPAFEVWQRGTGSTSCTAAARTFLADRWFVRPEGAATTQERSTTVPTGSLARYSLKVTGAGSVTTVDIGQRVEAANVPPMARTVTFLWRVYNATGAALTPNLRIGTPAAADDFATVTNRLDQSLQACADGEWTTVSHTVDISGYTNLANGIEVVLRFPTGSVVSGDYVLVTEAQATATAALAAFTRPGVRAEVDDCRRYYYVHVAGTTQSVGMAMYNGTSQVDTVVHFPTTMRKAPALVIATGSGYYSMTCNGSQDTYDGMSIYAATTNAATLFVTSNVSGTTARAGRIETTNAAASIAFDAELA